MSGFEYTPFGILPLGTNLSQMAETGLAGATVEVVGLAPQQPVQSEAVRVQLQPRQAANIQPAELKPVNVIRLARARLREVERDIKRLKKLEVERDELKRLLDAAAHKPARTLRSLPTRSA